MKQLNDITIEPSDAYKYLLKMTLRNKKKTEGFAIRGNDLQMILDWAEWKLTNELCGFRHTKANKMEDYKEV